MKTMHFMISVLGILLICLGCPLGAKPVQGMDLAALQPILNEQTVALVRLDVTKLDVDALTNRMKTILTEHGGELVAQQAQKELDGFRNHIGKAQQDLRAAGGKEIYAIFNMVDLPHFVIAVPIPAGADGGAIETWVKENQKAFRIGKLKTQRLDSVVLVGLAASVDMLLAMPTKDASVWMPSLQSCGETLLQLVLAPNANQRRVLVEMMPNMPFPELENLFVCMAQGLKWLGLGLHGSTPMLAQLTIQATGESQAQSLASTIQTIVNRVMKEPELQKIPQIQKQLDALTPRQRGARLYTVVNESQTKWLTEHFIGPSLARARSQVCKLTCGTNLSGIGKALLLYSNDHRDNFPPDLKTLIKAREMTPRGLICPSVGTEDSYVYRGKGLNCSYDTDMVLAHDRKENHIEYKGRNVLFMDSRVEWMTERAFQKAIQKDNEYRQKKGLPILPIE